MKETIDQLVAKKIFSIVNLAISSRLKPDITIDNVTELTEKEIEELRTLRGIEGVILDLDETLRIKMREIPPCNKEWLEMVRSRLKVIIVSNGNGVRAKEFFRLKGIDYIGFAYKPLKKNFLKACEIMKLDPEKVMVIGNDLILDIYGGKRNNMKTALVLRGSKDER